MTSSVRIQDCIGVLKGARMVFDSMRVTAAAARRMQMGKGPVEASSSAFGSKEQHQTQDSSFSSEYVAEESLGNIFL